jgi:hypothetical protein
MAEIKINNQSCGGIRDAEFEGAFHDNATVLALAGLCGFCRVLVY